MRVTHIITGLETGGAESMLVRLSEVWQRDGMQNEVVSLRGLGTNGPKLMKVGVRVHTLGLTGSVPSVRAFLGLRAATRASAPQVVQGWMYHGNLAALAAQGGSGPKAPVVWNIRHSIYDLAYEKPLTRLVIRLGALLSRRASRIIYNSRTSAAQHAALGFAGDRAQVLPNGFDTERFRPDPEARSRWRAALSIAGDAFVIGLVGRWHPMKDHATFIQAARRLLDRRPSAVFVMAGREVEASNPELVELLRAAALGERVRLLGECADIPGLTASFDVAACSSYSEAFPNVVGEALACAVPCVSTDVGDSAWIIGTAGRVVPPRDPEAMARAFDDLAGLSKEARRRLGAEGRDSVIRRFSLRQIAADYRSLYDEIAPAVVFR